MKSSVFFATFLLLFGFAICVSDAAGISNEYGKFVVTDTRGDYTVAFVLDSVNKKFPKMKEVEMIDYGNDGEGDMSVLLYKNGNKEVFFRTEDNYKRYVAENISANVCEDDWSPKIVYHKDRHAWACSRMNFLVKFFMWREIDNGLAEAKKGDWGALAERIIKNVEKFKK